MKSNERRRGMIGTLVVLAMLILLGGSPALPALATDANWAASYWNNKSMAGDPVLERAEPAVSYDWGSGSPAPGVVNVDNFSARWTRTVNFLPGTYRFSATVDDGVRLWVNNSLLIDQWQVQSVRTFTGNIYLPGGDVPLKLEYYENGGLAVMSLTWIRVADPTNAWLGEYFNNDTLSGSSDLVRMDANINFDWGSGKPATAIDADTFSVRWSQTPILPAGRYRFAVTADDGVRLFVNGVKVMDEWNEQSVRTFTADVDIPGGATPISLEYCEMYGLAVAKMTRTKLDVGEIVVDNSSAGFVKGGSTTGWHSESEGYGGSLLWTQNNDMARYNYNWARWYPSVGAGLYEVYVYIPDRFTTTAQARYWISHRDGFTLRIVNQSGYSDSWVSLGTYQFQGTSADYVSLADVTYEPYMTRLIGYDAIKWVPR
ncbi:MAG: hypothetical protein H6651_10710 [Ardenticatenales bacterium]|nr:hypothetical protein [Ardenticatenales bacterium]